MSPRVGDRVAVIGLLLLAPVCAEYLIGYDTSTGDVLALLWGLVLLAPLYGAPAVLIRELARRFGVGWPGILMMALALGIVQAGILDQSLFSAAYRDIDYLAEAYRPTLIEPFGVSAGLALTFLVGHVVWSFSIPIALVEGVRGKPTDRPWLSVPELILVALLYLGTAALFLLDHLRTKEEELASQGQLIGAGATAAVLFVLAFTLGRRRTSRSGRAPFRDWFARKPFIVFLVGLGVALNYDRMPTTWLGVAIVLAVLAAVIVVVIWLSRSSRWSGRNVVALATGGLVAAAVVAFLTDPLGNEDPTAKFTHNAVLALGVVILCAVAWRRSSRAYR
ncbi:MAG TPA: hypothetical protein VNP92_12395 [Actinophytocola sp.]|nr:hypothetical protein [Actinophytocola sp.]